MNDESTHHLRAARKLLQRSTRKTKLFWLNCVLFTRKSKRTRNVCDGETQTTPTHLKMLCEQIVSDSDDAFQIPAESCEVGSSREILDSDSDLYLESCELYDQDTDIQRPSTIDETQMECVTCLCVERIRDDGMCKLHFNKNAILDKLTDLQQEVNSIRSVLYSLMSGTESSLFTTKHSSVFAAGEKEIGSYSEHSSLQQPPPPPPPLPASPLFSHSRSLVCLNQRQSVPKVHFEEVPFPQERGKPVITLEEIQKVKLRQISSVHNIRCE